MDAVAATHSVVVVAVLVALLRPPTIKIKHLILLRRLNKNHSRTRWAYLVEEAVRLVSACNFVAVPNIEGSCLTEMGPGQ